jgi:hypothetical protein
VFGVVAVAATRVRLEVQAVVGSWTTCVSAPLPSAPRRREAASSSGSSLAMLLVILAGEETWFRLLVCLYSVHRSPKHVSTSPNA